VLDLGVYGGWCAETSRLVFCGQIILLALVFVRRTLTPRVFEIHDLLIYVAVVGSRRGIEFVHSSGAYNFEVAVRFAEHLYTPLPSAALILCLKHYMDRAVCSVCVGRHRPSPCCVDTPGPAK
jgi:hypothetical protein